MMKAMRSVRGRAVAVVVAVHVAAVMFGAMDPSGAVTKGVVPFDGRGACPDDDDDDGSARCYLCVVVVG